jgi:hypothetical protein
MNHALLFRVALFGLLSIFSPAFLCAQGLFEPLEKVVHFSPASSGIYLGSPSLLRLENGDLLAGMDMFGKEAPRPTVSLIFRSTDNGATWRCVAELQGSFWANLFSHREAVYYLGCSDQNGAIVIRRSDDNGSTWTSPEDERTGLLFPKTDDAIYHCAPMPVVEFEGRLYRAFENNPAQAWPHGFRSLVISADANADLLHASSWTASNPLIYDQKTDPAGYANGEENLSGGKSAGWLEGNVVITPDNQLVNILRVNSLPVVDQAAVVQIHDQGKRVSFNPESGFIDFPGGMSKFTIRRDPQTQVYWTISNGITNPDNPRQRNSLSLYSSHDLKIWKHHVVLLEDKDDFARIGNESKVGFQYIDYRFDGDDIIFLSRTAYHGAHNYHDANYMIFHRILNFRKTYTP